MEPTVESVPENSNPFSAPEPTVDVSRSVWVGRVRTFAILSVIQAGGELVASGMCFFFAVLMPSVLAMPPRPGQPAPMANLTAMSTMLTVIYTAGGSLMLVVAVLRMVAALRNFQFRGRIMAIVALSSGILGILVFPCFPTALGLMIYGLMLLLDPAVADAFAARKAGQSVAQVVSRYGQ